MADPSSWEANVIDFAAEPKLGKHQRYHIRNRPIPLYNLEERFAIV